MSAKPRTRRSPTELNWLACSQGALYVLTGLWPTVHMASFLAITGPKTDLWLAEAFGQLIATQGAVLVVFGAAQRVGAATVAFAFGSAAMLTFIDVAFVMARAISGVYLADAMVEGALSLLWLALWTTTNEAKARD